MTTWLTESWNYREFGSLVIFFYVGDWTLITSFDTKFSAVLYCFSRLGTALGSLCTHDDSGNRNPTNLHIWLWKIVFLHVHFSFFFDILKMFSFFVRHEMTCFAVVWTTWAYGDNCSILSRKVRTHFSSIMTLNNWKLIWETQGYIFRWRSRFRRRRACWSSLLPLTEYQTCKKFCIKQVHQDPISTGKKKKEKITKLPKSLDTVSRNVETSRQVESNELVETKRNKVNRNSPFPFLDIWGISVWLRHLGRKRFSRKMACRHQPPFSARPNPIAWRRIWPIQYGLNKDENTE